MNMYNTCKKKWQLSGDAMLEYMLYTLCRSTSMKKQDDCYVHTYADDDSINININ